MKLKKKTYLFSLILFNHYKKKTTFFNNLVKKNSINTAFFHNTLQFYYCVLKKKLHLIYKHFFFKKLLNNLNTIKFLGIPKNFIFLLNKIFTFFNNLIFIRHNKVEKKNNFLYNYLLTKTFPLNSNSIVSVNFHFLHFSTKSFLLIFFYLKIIIYRLLKVFYNK